MYKNKNIILYLPTTLIEKINKDILIENGKQYRTKNNFLKCISIIHYKQIYEYHSKFSYVATGKAYWSSIFGNTYKKKVINPLIETGILEFYDFGRNFTLFSAEENTKKGQVQIRYRINPELMNEEIGCIQYLNKGQRIADKKIVIPEQEYFPKQYQRRFFRITIDDYASNWLEENAGKVCEEYLNLNYVNALPPEYVIKYRELLEEGTYDPKYSSIQAAIAMAETLGKQLFYYNKDYYLADLESFIVHRTEGILYQYNTEIIKVKTLPLISTRSDNTLRVYNHLVNFPSKLLPFLRINGQPLVQIDLSTSQFLLFANLINVYLNEGFDRVKSLFKNKVTKRFINRFIKVIKNYDTVLPSTGIDREGHLTEKDKYYDVLQFIDAVFNGDFYEHVKHLLNLPDRGIAKITLFQLLFRRKNRTDEFVEILRNHYPTVMSIMEDFKDQVSTNKEEVKQIDEDEESNLSVFLQCVEAEIYIDRILKPLQEKNIPCFTRHDSICIPESMLDEVQSFIIRVFNEFGFKYRSKIECYSEQEELKVDLLEDDYEYEDVEEFLLNSLDSDQNLSDQEIPEHLIEHLNSINLLDDYSAVINESMLEEIALLPMLDENQRNCLLDDVANIRSGMSFFQDQTNEILTEILNKL